MAGCVLPDRDFVKAICSCSLWWACENTGWCLGKWCTGYSHASVKTDPKRIDPKNPWKPDAVACIFYSKMGGRLETPWKLIGQLSRRPCLKQGGK